MSLYSWLSCLQFSALVAATTISMAAPSHHYGTYASQYAYNPAYANYVKPAYATHAKPAYSYSYPKSSYYTSPLYNKPSSYSYQYQFQKHPTYYNSYNTGYKYNTGYNYNTGYMPVYYG